jgi:hypothetical protein
MDIRWLLGVYESDLLPESGNPPIKSNGFWCSQLS